MDAGELGSLRRAARFIVKEMGRAADRAIRNFAPGGRVPTRAGGTGTTQGAEPPLGNPASDGDVLSSTTAGVRSWVPLPPPGLRLLDATGAVDLPGSMFLRFGAGVLSFEGPDGALYLPPVATDGTDIVVLVPVLDGLGDPVVDGDGNQVYVYAPFVAPGGPLRHAASVGDGVATTIVVNHGLGASDVIVQVRQVATPFAVVYPDIAITDSNNVTLDFAVAPTTNEYRVVVLG